jgi:phosphohistidine phosphatase SixA
MGNESSDDLYKTIYIVRHAEKDLNDTTDNPPLTLEGEKRAKSLVKKMRFVKLDQIYSTKFQRNLHTVQPLATKKKLSITNFVWADYLTLVEEIKKSSLSTFLICGHGDIIIPIIKAFGGIPLVESLAHDEYDKIFEVKYSKSNVIVRMRVY